MTEEELKKIRERCEKATEGPWGVYDYGVYSTTIMKETIPEVKHICGDVEWDDSEFIAHARTDIPKLLDEVEQLKDKYVKLERRYHGLRETIEQDNE